MALAILELLEVGREGARFSIDTGTSRFFQLRLGRSTQERGGINWVDGLAGSSPVMENPNGGNPFQTRTELSVPASRLGNGAAYAQVFSFKTRDRAAPAYSNVVQISSGWSPAPLAVESRRLGSRVSQATAFNSTRRVPCSTISDRYAATTSLEDVLAGVVKLAAPLVEQLLGAGPKEVNNGKAPPAASVIGGQDALAKVLAVLLKSILGGAGQPLSGTSQSLSISSSSSVANRFDQVQFSHPFIFGIDDALIGTILGPVLKILPELLNSANNRKIAERQADDKLMSDIESGINRRLILQQLANSQPANTTPSPELQKLMDLLGQPSAPIPTGSAAGSAPVVGLSLAASDPNADIVSSRAIVSFSLAPPLPWNGATQLLFSRANDIAISVKLLVGAPAPKAPVPRAIIRVVFKDSAQKSVLLEKVFKMKDFAANAQVKLAFTNAEIAVLPTNRVLEVIVEIRWRTSTGNRAYKALGSIQLVVVSKYILKSQGGLVGTERELTDMTQFRAFWNKIWESPVLDAATPSPDGERQRRWAFDVTAKYSMFLSSDHVANGLMETKFQKASQDPESSTLRSAGRLKSGIELSNVELNKLLPLWQGHVALDADQLEALSTDSFSGGNSGEAITSLKFAGSAGQRGIVWAIPVFNLAECTLATVAKVAESGQVTALADTIVGFPIPVAARLIALKSKS